MTEKLDYSREEAMEILNNESYSDDQKRTIYDEYMNNLKNKRKNEIVSRLNIIAKDIPNITKEIYIAKLKEYENDDLSKPFKIIEKELSNFEDEMKSQYNEYLEKQSNEPEEIIPDIKPKIEDDFEDTIFNDTIVPKYDMDEDDEMVPSFIINDSVLNEEPDELTDTLYDSEEIMPEDFPENKESGNASAIILSIIAVIIGAIVMYSIIKLN